VALLNGHKWTVVFYKDGLLTMRVIYKWVKDYVCNGNIVCFNEKGLLYRVKARVVNSVCM